MTRRRWAAVLAAVAVALPFLLASDSGRAETAGAGVPALIDAAAAAYGVPAWRMHRIARCESGYFPRALNPRSGAAGVFQWLPSSWAWASPRAGWGGYSVFDPEANVYTAAHWMARGYWSWWVCR